MLLLLLMLIEYSTAYEATIAPLLPMHLLPLRLQMVQQVPKHVRRGLSFMLTFGGVGVATCGVFHVDDTWLVHIGGASQVTVSFGPCATFDTSLVLVSGQHLLTEPAA